MANSTEEFWDWNGTSLNREFWNITTFGGSRQDLPLLRGGNYTVAYRAGQMWRPKQPDQRKITLAMWTAGVSQSTLLPGTDQRLDFNTNFQNLRSLFWTQGNFGSALGSLTRRWRIVQSGVSQLVSGIAQAEIAGTMTPSMSGRTRADFAVDFILADPYFYGVSQTQALPYNSAQTVNNLGDGVVGFGQPSGFGGTPFTVQLNGPLTSPTLTNLTTGVSVTVGYTITAGHFCTLDVMSYTAVDDTGTSHLGVVSHAGARPWMILAEGNNSLKLTSVNGGDTGTASLTWSPPYL